MDILLHAYVAQNLGDDLFLSLICKRYPQHTFYLFAEGRFIEQYKQIPNLRIMKIYVLPKLLRKVLCKVGTINFDMSFEYFQRWILQKKAMKFAEFQVWLGGSQFVETKNWRTILSYKKYQQQFHTPFVSISATAGPFLTEKYKQKAIEVIKGYDEICFRDKKSYEITGELSNARYEMDMVFALDRIIPLKQKKKIVLSMIDVHSKFRSTPNLGIEYEKKLLEIAQYYNDCGYELCFLSCCTLQGDTRISQKLIAQIRNPISVKIVEYTGDLAAFLAEIADAQMMVATRYHANVVALRYGLKVLPIIYEDKTRFLLENLRRPGVELKEMHTISVKNINAYFIQLSPEEIRTCVESAKRQYQAIDELIRRK